MLRRIYDRGGMLHLRIKILDRMFLKKAFVKRTLRQLRQISSDQLGEGDKLRVEDFALSLLWNVLDVNKHMSNMNRKAKGLGRNNCGINRIIEFSFKKLCNR
jgi:hypothetical protein